MIKMNRPGRFRPGRANFQLTLLQYYAVCQRASKTMVAVAASAFVRGDVVRGQTREAFQLHCDMPTIKTDERIAMVHGHIPMTL